MKLVMSQSESVALLGIFSKAVQEGVQARAEVDGLKAKIQELESALTLVKRDLSDANYYKCNAEKNCEAYRVKLTFLEGQAANTKLTGEQQVHLEARIQQAFIEKLPVLCKHLHNREKIPAIKLVRELTRMGLREAKDCVEGTYDFHGHDKSAGTLGDLIRKKLAETPPYPG